jgi:hypothetical protein
MLCDVNSYSISTNININKTVPGPPFRLSPPQPLPLSLSLLIRPSARPRQPPFPLPAPPRLAVCGFNGFKLKIIVITAADVYPPRHNARPFYHPPSISFLLPPHPPITQAPVALSPITNSPSDLFSPFPRLLIYK